MIRTFLGIRGRVVSQTEIARIPDQVCRACGREFIPMMASTAHRKTCRYCGGVLIQAVGEV